MLKKKKKGQLGKLLVPNWAVRISGQTTTMGAHILLPLAVNSKSEHKKLIHCHCWDWNL
jgi:hypothetical protein